MESLSVSSFKLVKSSFATFIIKCSSMHYALIRSSSYKRNCRFLDTNCNKTWKNLVRQRHKRCVHCPTRNVKFTNSIQLPKELLLHHLHTNPWNYRETELFYMNTEGWFWREKCQQWLWPAWGINRAR